MTELDQDQRDVDVRAGGRQQLRGTLVPLAMAAIPHEDTGSYRSDMLAVLHGWARFFAGPAGAMGPAVVGAMPQHRFLVTGDPITPELIEQVVDEILIPYVSPRPGSGG